MGELVYSMDVLAPKHKMVIDLEGRFDPKILRSMPEIMSSVLGIPLYKVYEDKLMWDISPGERIDIFAKWVALDTEIDPHSVLRYVVEARGFYRPKERGGRLNLTFKAFVDTKMKYFTVIDKKLKEQYVKTIYLPRRKELRKIGWIYIEKLYREVKKLLGIEGE